MQAEISPGNGCPWFLQITGEHLLASAGNLREAFIVRVKADFTKPRDVFFQYQTIWPKSPLAAFEVNGKLFKTDSVPKKWTVICWLINPLSKNIQLTEIFLTVANLITNRLFFIYFQGCQVKAKCHAKLRFELKYVLKAQAILVQL